MEEVEELEGGSQFRFSFEGFEGPFDLLLELIAKKNIEIKDVKLAEITGQFLQ